MQKYFGSSEEFSFDFDTFDFLSEFENEQKGETIKNGNHQDSFCSTSSLPKPKQNQHINKTSNSSEWKIKKKKKTVTTSPNVVETHHESFMNTSTPVFEPMELKNTKEKVLSPISPSKDFPFFATPVTYKASKMEQPKTGISELTPYEVRIRERPHQYQYFAPQFSPINSFAHLDYGFIASPFYLKTTNPHAYNPYHQTHTLNHSQQRGRRNMVSSNHVRRRLFLDGNPGTQNNHQPIHLQSNYHNSYQYFFGNKGKPVPVPVPVPVVGNYSSQMKRKEFPVSSNFETNKVRRKIITRSVSKDNQNSTNSEENDGMHDFKLRTNCTKLTKKRNRFIFVNEGPFYNTRSKTKSKENEQDLKKKKTRKRKRKRKDDDDEYVEEEEEDEIGEDQEFENNPNEKYPHFPRSNSAPAMISPRKYIASRKRNSVIQRIEENNSSIASNAVKNQPKKKRKRKKKYSRRISCGIAENVKSMIKREEFEKRLRDQKTTKRCLPSEAVEVLKNWFLDHLKSPYPSASDKKKLVKETNLQRSQVEYWFTNKRKRIWKNWIKELEAKANANGKK